MKEAPRSPIEAWERLNELCDRPFLDVMPEEIPEYNPRTMAEVIRTLAGNASDEEHTGLNETPLCMPLDELHIAEIFNDPNFIDDSGQRRSRHTFQVPTTEKNGAKTCAMFGKILKTAKLYVEKGIQEVSDDEILGALRCLIIEFLRARGVPTSVLREMGEAGLFGTMASMLFVTLRQKSIVAVSAWYSAMWDAVGPRYGEFFPEEKG